jgi:hypothetical protein
MEDSSDSDESVILRAKQRQLRKKEMGARLATRPDAEAIHTHIAGTFFPVVSARLSQLQSQFRRHLDAKRDEHSDSDPESDQDKSGPMVRAAACGLFFLLASRYHVRFCIIDFGVVSNAPVI